MCVKEKPQVPLIGQNGNVFNLLMIAGRYLEPDTKNEMIHRVTTEAKSYEDSINIIGEYVEIV